MDSWRIEKRRQGNTEKRTLIIKTNSATAFKTPETRYYFVGFVLDSTRGSLFQQLFEIIREARNIIF